MLKCGECLLLRDRHRTRPGRLDGRTDGQPSRPVPELRSAQHAVPSPDGSEDGRPVHRKTEGRTDGTDDYDRIYWWLRVSESQGENSAQMMEIVADPSVSRSFRMHPVGLCSIAILSRMDHR
jgi:hypothetical protein